MVPSPATGRSRQIRLAIAAGVCGVISIKGQCQGESFGGIGAGYSVPNLGGGEG
jgi:hypothetical protein